MANVSNIGEYVLGLLERKDRREDKDLDRELKMMELNATIREKQKDREWNRESQMIEFYTDLSQTLQAELSDAENSLITAGLTVEDLNAVNPVDISGNAIGIAQSHAENISETVPDLIASLDSIKGPLASHKKRLSHFNSGKNLFNSIAGEDGVVDAGELNQYFAKSPIEEQYRDEFLAGINASSPDAQSLQALAMSDVEMNLQLNKLAKGDLDLKYWEQALTDDQTKNALTIEIMKAQQEAQELGNDDASMRLSFLLTTLENKEELDSLNIDLAELRKSQDEIELQYLPQAKLLGIKSEELSLKIGEQTHLKLVEEVKISQETLKQSKIKTSVDEVALAAVEDEVEIGNLTKAKGLAESGLVNNITNQNDVGASIAVGLAVTASRMKNGTYAQYSLATLEALSASDPISYQNALDEIVRPLVTNQVTSESTGIFKASISDLITSLNYAKAEEGVGDYTLFLEQIVQVKSVHDNFTKVEKTASFQKALGAVEASLTGWQAKHMTDFEKNMKAAAIYYKGKNQSDYNGFLLGNSWDAMPNNLFTELGIGSQGIMSGPAMLEHAATLVEQEAYYKMHLDGLEELLMGQNVQKLEKWDYKSDPNMPSATKNALNRIFANPI
jgi:hypothetical protein